MKGLRKLPTQDRSRVMIDDLLQACAQLITEFGINKSTTNRIAKKAGVSIGSLYQYFPNRDAIIEALTSRIEQRHHEQICNKLKEVTHLSEEERVATIVSLVVNLTLEKKEIFRQLFRWAPELSLTDYVDRTRRSISRELERVLREDFARPESIDGVSLRVQSRIVVSATLGVLEDLVFTKQDALDPAEVTQQLSRMLHLYIHQPSQNTTVPKPGHA